MATPTATPQQEKKRFMQLENKEIQDTYAAYKEIISSQPDITPREIRQQLSSFVSVTYSLSTPLSDKVAKNLYDLYSSPDYLSQFIAPETDVLYLSASDLSLFFDKISSEASNPDQHLANQIRSLLLSFIVHYRMNYHPSGKIQYDRKSIFYLAGLSKLPSVQQQALTQYLHIHYNLDMYVVGSNRPIPCFALPWLEQSSPDPIIKFGPLEPITLSLILSEGTIQQ